MGRKNKRQKTKAPPPPPPPPLSDEEGSGGEEMMLDIDDEGRVAPTSNVGLNFGFRSLQTGLANTPREGLRLLQEDCTSLFGGEGSYWMPVGFTPRCDLERLVMEVFEYHAGRALEHGDVDRAKSGAEWWVQVRKDGEGEGGIGFHWDKDEDLVDASGYTVNPQVSTVTYITTGGAPTFILNSAAPREYDDAEAMYADDITQGWLSHPQVGKHVSFDGRFFHGAVGELSWPGPDTSRVTLLVNVWLNHVPMGPQPLPKAALKRLSKNINVKLDLAACEEAKSLPTVMVPEDAREFTSTFGPNGNEHRFTFTYAADTSATENASSIEVGWAAGHRPAITANSPILESAPEVTGKDTTLDQALEQYLPYQLVVIRNCAVKSQAPWEGLRQVYGKHGGAVKDSWTMENGSKSVGPEGVLGEVAGECGNQWYASFVLNGADLITSACDEVGWARPACMEGDDMRLKPCAWFFFGQNNKNKPLRGRPEHTDIIRHSGTFHVQMSGSKRWLLRPKTTDEGAQWPYGPCPSVAGDHRLRIDVRPGDVIAINTSLWYHETELPCSTDAAGGLSFSVARDFELGERDDDDESEVEMDNLEDTWATSHIRRGTVIGKGDELATVRLQRVAEPNCELVPRKRKKVEGGPVRQVDCRLVALRDIAKGESLTVKED